MMEAKTLFLITEKCQVFMIWGENTSIHIFVCLIYFILHFLKPLKVVSKNKNPPSITN